MAAASSTGCVAGFDAGMEYAIGFGLSTISFTTTAAPPISRIITIAAAAVAFVFEIATAITAPFAREIAAPVPVSAVTAAAEANAAGAGCDAVARIPAMVAAAGAAPPAGVSICRNFSIPRHTRFLAASSEILSAAPTSRKLLPSKNRNRIASRSCAPSRFSARSTTSSAALFDVSSADRLVLGICAASISCRRRFAATRSALHETYRAVL